MQFLLYLGSKQAITVENSKLSKSYRFGKGIPTPVMNYNDIKILLKYEEKKTGCGGCGASYGVKVIMTDVAWCKLQKIDLIEYRNEWEEYYNKS